MMLRVLDLFSGIGGMSLGLERTGGFTTVAFCERNIFCQRLIRQTWRGATVYSDVRSLTADKLAADGIAVDVIAGGFPCQDVSIAGSKSGLAGERSGLWEHYARLVGELRPRYAIVENVTGLLVWGMGDVLGELSEIGYDAEWHAVPASAVGAPHRRDRVWIVAYPNATGWFAERLAQHAEQSRARGDQPHRLGPPRFRDGPFPHTDVAGRAQQWCAIPVHAALAQFECSDWWKTEPGVGRVVDGLPDRVDRIEALGNAVVPQIVEIIGRAILRHDRVQADRRGAARDVAGGDDGEPEQQAVEAGG